VRISGAASGITRLAVPPDPPRLLFSLLFAANYQQNREPHEAQVNAITGNKQVGSGTRGSIWIEHL